MRILKLSDTQTGTWIGVTVGLLLVLGLAAVAWTRLVSTTGPLLAPQLQINDIQGRPVAIGQDTQRPVLLTFWSTTCGPCLAEIPFLKSVQETWGPQGLEVLAVAMHYDRPDAVIALSKRQAMNYRVALDPTNRTAEAFGGVTQTPAHFLIAADGRIVLRWVGKRPDAEIMRHITALLPKQKTAASTTHLP